MILNLTKFTYKRHRNKPSQDEESCMIILWQNKLLNISPPYATFSICFRYVFSFFLNGSGSPKCLTLLLILPIIKFGGLRSMRLDLFDSLSLLKTDISRLSPWYPSSSDSLFFFLRRPLYSFGLMQKRALPLFFL